MTDRFPVNDCELDQLVPAIAFDGAHHVVAWGDRRRGPEQVYRTLLEPGGAVLDTLGLRLAGQDTMHYQSQPALASNGENCYVAWLGGTDAGAAVHGMRLDRAGEPLDSAPHRFTDDTLFQLRARVASDGNAWLVAWCGEAPGAAGDDIRCQRVGPDGTMLDSVPVLLAHGDGGFADPDVAFARGRYLVTWTDQDGFDVRGCRVTADGRVLDPGGFAIAERAGLQRDAVVASDGDRFLVAWADDYRGGFDICGVLVDSAGTVGTGTVPVACAVRAPGVRVLPSPARGPVRFALDGGAGPVKLRIHDAAGRLVRTLPAGTTRWDRADESGRPVPQGVYAVVIEQGPARAGTGFAVLR